MSKELFLMHVMTCLMPKKCLSNDCDENVSNNVNDKPAQKNEPRSRTRYIERLIKSYKCSTSRIFRRFLNHRIWIPMGKEFTFEDGNLVVVEPKQVETSFACDSVLTPNPVEPNSLRFPNTNSSVLDRLSKFVFGSSTRVAPST